MAFMVLPEFFYSGHFLSNERKWSGFFVAFSLFLDIDEGECSPSEFPCWMFFLLSVVVVLFCFFLKGVFGQQSWRNAFLRSEAHAFQHFGLAHYAAITVRKLVEGFVVIPLQAGQPVADTEEGVGKACNFSYKMVPRLMIACTFFTWFSFFQRSSERRRALIRLVGLISTTFLL